MSDLDDIAAASQSTRSSRRPIPARPVPLSRGIMAACILGPLAVVGIISNALKPAPPPKVDQYEARHFVSREGVPAAQKVAEPLPAAGGNAPLFSPESIPASGKTQWVKGYTKKDGTVVQGYYRRARN